MERVTRVSKNAIALVAAKLVTSGLSFLMAIIINRELGPVKIGIYNYAFVLYTIFQVIPDFGIGNISVRDVSQDNSKLHYYFRNIVALRLLLGLLAFALLMTTNLLTTALSAPGELTAQRFWAVFAIAFCLFIEQPLSNTLLENFIALERLTVVALVYLILGTVRVALSIYVVLAGFNHILVLLILIYILCYLYSIFHFYIIYHRLLRRNSVLSSGCWVKSEATVHIPEVPGKAAEEVLAEVVAHAPTPPGQAAYASLVADISYADLTHEESPATAPENHPVRVSTGENAPPGNEATSPPSGPSVRPYNREFWFYLLRSAWPLAVVSSGVIIYAVVEIPILAWMKGDKEVGLYMASAMFAKAFVFFTLAINMAVLPAISKVGGKFPERLGVVWQRLMYYTLVLTVPLVILTPVLARPFLIFQAHDYMAAYDVVWLTMAAMNFTFLTAISFPFFVVIGKQKLLTGVILAGLAIKVTLDLIAISIWGYTGAAVVMVISEFLVFAMICVTLARELKHRVNIPGFAGTQAVAAAVLYTVALVLNALLVRGKDTLASSAVSALILAAILTVIYLAFAFASGMLKKSRLKELNDWLTVE